jgi:hypothetical protein
VAFFARWAAGVVLATMTSTSCCTKSRTAASARSELPSANRMSREMSRPRHIQARAFLAGTAQDRCLDPVNPRRAHQFWEAWDAPALARARPRLGLILRPKGTLAASLDHLVGPQARGYAGHPCESRAAKVWPVRVVGEGQEPGFSAALRDSMAGGDRNVHLPLADGLRPPAARCRGPSRGSVSLRLGAISVPSSSNGSTMTGVRRGKIYNAAHVSCREQLPK